MECQRASATKAVFENGIVWPKCDLKELPKCEDFPDPPPKAPIGITDKTPVLPGASVFYQCTGFGQVSTRGENIEVCNGNWNINEM